MKAWLTSLLNDVNEQIQDPGHQLTAAYFIIMCLGKVYRSFHKLPNSTILSLAEMITLHPDSPKSCPGYDLVKRHLSDKIMRYLKSTYNCVYYILASARLARVNFNDFAARES